MLMGLALLWVGAVLCLNGLWLMGRIGDREIAVVNVFVGLVSGAVAWHSAFGPAADAGSIKAAALTLLFTLTYFWVAANRYNGADGRGLGWFSLFVALTLVPVTLDAFRVAASPAGHWLAWCWAAWALLWLMFFVLLVLQKPIAKLTGAVTLAQGVLTGWVPGYLLLTGALA